MTQVQRRRIILVHVFVLGCAASAAAQTEGRVSVGGSVTINASPDADVGSSVGIGPLVRLNPKHGLRPAGALNWDRLDLHNPAGGDAPFARLRMRPLMGGVGYTIGPPETLVTFSIVAGPSFNSVTFEDEFLDTVAGTPSIEVKTSFAVRPGVSLTRSLSPRVGIVGFGGYMINRPKIVYRRSADLQVEDHWRGDSIVLSVGLVYSLF
jgi:hypothetical protein